MRRKFKVISFVISMIIVPCAFSVERDPVETADVIGRDLNVPGLGFLGHVGLWNAQSRKVYEMLDEKDSWGGSNLWISNTIDNFKSRSRYWGAAYVNGLKSKPPVLSCFNLIYTPCPEGSYSAPLGLMQNVIIWWAIGADYTVTTSFTLPQKPYYNQVPPSPWGGPALGQYVPAKKGRFRCDTFVRAVFGIQNTIPSTFFPSIVTPLTTFNSLSRR